MVNDSKFFEPVVFGFPPPDASKPVPVVSWDREIIQKAFKEIIAEIEQIKGGISPLTTYAIDPGKFEFACLNSLELFVQSPSDKSLQIAWDVSKQDLGVRAGNYFYGLLKASRSENPNE